MCFLTLTCTIICQGKTNTNQQKAAIAMNIFHIEIFRMFVLAWKLLALLSISLKLSFENWGEGIHSDSSNAPSCTYQSHPSIELSLRGLCIKLAILNGIFVFLFFSWFCLAGRFYCRSTQREFGKVVCFGHTRNIDRAVARRWFSIAIIIISIVIITIMGE